MNKIQLLLSNKTYTFNDVNENLVKINFYEIKDICFGLFTGIVTYSRSCWELDEKTNTSLISEVTSSL